MERKRGGSLASYKVFTDFHHLKQVEQSKKLRMPGFCSLLCCWLAGSTTLLLWWQNLCFMCCWICSPVWCVTFSAQKSLHAGASTICVFIKVLASVLQSYVWHHWTLYSWGSIIPLWEPTVAMGLMNCDLVNLSCSTCSLSASERCQWLFQMREKEKAGKILFQQTSLKVLLLYSTCELSF